MSAIKTLRGNAQQIYDKSLNIQKLKHFDHLWAILDNLRLYLPNMHVFLKKKYGWGGFSNFLYGSETMHMTSEGLREMSEGHFADMCAEK